MNRRGALAFAGALALLVAGLLTLAADRAEAADYEWPITRIVDGDTLKADAGADIPGELAALSVRIRGIDTPEKGGRSKCESERARGQAATAFTSQTVAGARSNVIADPELGTWGGRVIADVVVDGRSLAAALLAAGHALSIAPGAEGGFVLSDPLTGAAVLVRRDPGGRYEVAGESRLYCDAVAALVGEMRRAGGGAAKIEPVRVAVALTAIEAEMVLEPRGRAAVV